MLITLIVELQSFTSLVPKSSTPATSHHHEHIRTNQETRRQPRGLQKEDRRNPRVNVRGEESQPAAAILKGRRCRTLCWGGLVTCTRESDRLAPIAVNTSVLWKRIFVKKRTRPCGYHSTRSSRTREDYKSTTRKPTEERGRRNGSQDQQELPREKIPL